LLPEKFGDGEEAWLGSRKIRQHKNLLHSAWPIEKTAADSVGHKTRTGNSRHWTVKAVSADSVGI